MGVVTDLALLPAGVLGDLDLRLRARPPRHGLMAQGAKLYRIRGNRQLAFLGVALGRAMADFAGHRLVVVGGPLRVAFAVASLAVACRLVDRFLGGNFGDCSGAVVAELIKRVDGEKPFRDQRYGSRRDEKYD